MFLRLNWGPSKKRHGSNCIYVIIPMLKTSERPLEISSSHCFVYVHELLWFQSRTSRFYFVSTATLSVASSHTCGPYVSCLSHGCLALKRRSKLKSVSRYENGGSQCRIRWCTENTETLTSPIDETSLPADGGIPHRLCLPTCKFTRNKCLYNGV